MTKQLFFILIFMIIVDMGCSKNPPPEDYLLKVRDRTVSLYDFNQAVEAAGEEAFPDERTIDPKALDQLRIEVLNQLSEELIIMEYGKDLGIRITDAELEKAVAGIKADYPDNTFDETLLENAVSFDEWKKKLATRLLVEKVISQELTNKVQLSSEDMSNYYKGLNKDNNDSEPMDGDEQNETLVRQLRRLKAELSYQKWIEELKVKYPVELNRQQWEKITRVEKK